MSNRYQKLHLLKKVMGALLVMTAVLMVTQVAYAAKKKATKFVLEKTQGTVRVESSAKEELDLWDGMQLYNGDHQVTDSESYAWVSLDETKVIKLDENTETMLKKAFLSKKLEVRTLKGKIFFNVTVPLANDEAFNIRTSTMVTGIRGTCGWVEVTDDWLSTVYLLTGELECLVVNPLDNGSETITLKPGQYAEFYVFPKSEMGNGEVSCGVTMKTFTKEDIPGFVLEEILGNQELIDKILKESGIDLNGLTKEYVEERKLADQEKHQKEIRLIEEKAAEELNVVEKDPVWKPANTDRPSAVAYLIMPQTAETVQKYLDIEKYGKVVLLPENGTEDDNTLKVDVDFTAPEGKTLEARAGVPVRVLKGSSFTVDGTANLYARMSNEGTVTVRSSNTLMLQDVLVNMGILEITETGRLVLGKGMTTNGTFKNAGTVEAAPEASGEEMIVIDGGEVIMLSGMISSNRYETIMRLSSGAKAEFHFSGGTIANEMEDGASILAGEEDFQVTVLGTDIIGVTDTILGKEAVLEKYNAGSVFRKDERFHLIELDKVDSYPVVVANVEHGTIIAPNRVEVGAKVTLIAVPDEGYELESLTVNAYNAKTKRTGGSVSLAADHSFIMPASDVIVGGSFVKIEAEAKYQVNVTAADGGTVSATPAEADAGETVSLSIRKGEGHELESLTVTSADGSAIGVVASGEGYQFVMPASNVNVRATFRALDVNVVFYDEDKVTVLNHQTVPYGTVPKYAGSTEPEKESDEEYSYTFAGWKLGEDGETYAADATLPAVKKDAKFIAVYAKKELDKPYVAPTVYTVTWRDWDGSVIKEDRGLAWGTIPRYEGDVVYRDPDAQYTYDMTGWTSAAGTFHNGEELPAVTANITYTAHYDLTIRKYTILWVNEDGSELEKDTLVPYGETPEYNGPEPAKQRTPQYTFRFAGWDGGVVPVTGDKTYTAKYTEELNSYLITFLNDEGNLIEEKEWNYGETPAVSTTPEKQGTPQYSYDFTGWDHEIEPVTGDDTYKAVFTGRTNTYKVTWLNWDNTPLETQYNISFGTTASYPGATVPGRTGDAQYSYNFAGWEVGTTQYATGSLMPEVQGDLTLKAYFDEIVNQYDVTFLDDDGTTVIQATAAYDYGTEGTNYAPANPTKQETAKFIYTFDGWTVDGTTKYQTAADLPDVTGDVTYVATYKETIKQYAVSFINYDGTALMVNGQASQSYDYDTLGSAIARPADPTRDTDNDFHYQFSGWSDGQNDYAADNLPQVTGTVTYTATYQTTAVIHPTSVSLDQTDLELYIGGTSGSLTATVLPDTAENKNVQWTIGDTTLADLTKSTDGLTVTISPKANGDTTITVETEDGGKTATCDLHVRTAVTGVTLTTDSVQNKVILGAHSQATATLEPATASNKKVTWASGDENILKIVGDSETANVLGKATATITPVAAGSTTITVTTDDGGFSETLTLTVAGYNVRWENYDGTALAVQPNEPFDSDPAYPGTTDPTRDPDPQYSYIFTGWMANGVKYEMGVDALPKVNQNYTFRAYYTEKLNQYNVTFVDDDGTTSLKAATAYDYGTSGTGIVPPANPTKNPSVDKVFTFAGWTVDGTTVYETNADLPEVKGDITFKAVYSEDAREYTIKFHYDGDDLSKFHSQQVAYNTVPTYDNTYAPVKAATAQVTYTFVGWADADGNQGLTSVTGDKDYYAEFGEAGKTFGITYNLNAGGDASAKIENAVTSYIYGVGTTLPGSDKVTRDGYEFAGWYLIENPTANDAKVTTIGTTEAEDKTFFAQWTAKENTLTVELTGGGVFNIAGVGHEVDSYDKTFEEFGSMTHKYVTDQTVYVGVELMKTEIANPITELTTPNSITVVDADGQNVAVTYANGRYSFKMPPKDCKVTLNIVNYTVFFSEETENGYAYTNIANFADAGDLVHLYAVPDDTYEFSEFIITDTEGEDVNLALTKVEDNHYTFTMPANDLVILTIFEKEKFDVTFVDDDDANNTQLYVQQAVPYGTKPVYSGTSAPSKASTVGFNYTFKGWILTKDTATVPHVYTGGDDMPEVDGAITLKAYYEASVRSYTVSFDLMAEGDATAKINDTTVPTDYKYGTGVTLPTDVTRDDYTFTGWYEKNTPGTIVTAVGTTDSGDKTFCATWEERSAVYYTTGTDSANSGVLLSFYNSAGTDRTKLTNGILKSDAYVVHVPNVTTVKFVDDIYPSSVTAAFKGLYGLKKVENLENLHLDDAKDLSYMFDQCAALQEIDLSVLDLSSVTNMEYMFDSCSSLTSIRLTGDLSNVTSMANMFSYCTRLESVNMENLNVSSCKTMANMFADCNSLKEAKFSGINTALLEDMSYMFRNCKTLTVAEVNDFDTSNVVTMAYLFDNCSSLEEVDLSSWDTTKLTNMQSMFRDCAALKTVDLSGFDTSNVTSMTSLFNGCTNLMSVDLSSFDTKKVTDMYGMFYNCTNLYVIDVSSFDTGEVTKMGAMFASDFDDYNLTTIYASGNFKTTKVTNSTSMFWGRKNLTGGNGTTYVQAYTEASYAWIDGVDGKPGYFTDKSLIGEGLFYTLLAENSVNTLRLYGHSGAGRMPLTGDALDSSLYQSTNAAISIDVSAIQKVVITEEIQPTSVASAFKGCSALEEIENLEYLHVEGLTDLSEMFSGCSNLTELDLSSFDTTGATKMANIFSGCSNLETIYASDKFDASAVTDDDAANGGNMFTGCSKLVGGYGTRAYNDPNSATNYSYVISKNFARIDSRTAGNYQMGFFTDKNAKGDDIYYTLAQSGSDVKLTFYDHEETDSIKLLRGAMTSYSYSNGGILARSVTTVEFANEIHPGTLYDAFKNMTDLTTIVNLTNLKTDKVMNMYSAFENTGLTGTLNFSSFDTSHVIAADSMFAGCSDLEGLILNGWTNDELTSTVLMFSQCSGLKTLSLDGFMTDKVQSMYGMFYGCSSLTALDLSDFNTEQVEDMNDMFHNCTGLTVLDLSSFDTKNVEAMMNMFEADNTDTKLETIFVSDKFVLTNVQRSGNMFTNRTGLVGGAGTKYDNTVVDATYAVIDGGTTAPGYFTDITMLGATGVYYKIEDDGSDVVLHLFGTYASGMTPLANNALSSDQYVKGGAGAAAYDRTSITKVIIHEEIQPTSVEKAFQNCSRLTSIEGMGYLKTTGLDSMNYVFDGCEALNNLDLSGFDTASATTMIDMFKDCATLTSLDLTSFDTSSVTTMSGMFQGCTNLESVDLSSFDTEQVGTFGSMFENCKSLTELDLSSFDTRNAWGFSNMFYTNTVDYNLTTIYATDTFDPSHVGTDCGGAVFTNRMGLVGGQGTAYKNDPHSDSEYAIVDNPAASKPGFFTDKALMSKRIFYKLEMEGEETVLRLSATKKAGWQQVYAGMLNSSQYTNTSGETAITKEDITQVIIEEPIYPVNMDSAFYQCIKLKEIQNIEYLNTEDVTSMAKAFNDCRVLAALDLSWFDTAGVTSMKEMFTNSGALKTIYASESFVLTGLTDPDSDKDMFQSCWSLVGGLGTRLYLYSEGYSNPVDKTYAWMDGRDGKKGYFTGKNIVDPSSIYYQFTLNDGTTDEYTLHFYNAEGTGRSRLAGGVMHALAYENGELGTWQYRLTEIKIEDNIVPSDMAFAFASMYGTTIEGLAKIDTKNVTSMRYAFSGMPELAGELDLSTWDLSNVTDMNHMFYNNYGITSVKLSGATDKLTDMSYMFGNDEGLTSVELSNFNTKNVTDMSYMFYDCLRLTEINLAGINTESVTDMSFMFYRCESATTIDVSSFDTASVTNMGAMFLACKAVTSLDLSGFHTSKLTNAYSMFFDCISLTSLDISSFSTSSLENAYRMFGSGAPDYNLRAIFASDQFVMTAAMERDNNGDEMFLNRLSLAGGAGTVYDANNISYTYAKLDGGKVNPGYFTDVAMYGKEGLYYSLANENGEVVLRLYNKYIGNMTEIKNKELSSNAYVSGNLDKTSIERVVIMDEIKPASVASAFEDCYQIESIEGLEKLDITGITDMSNMFKGCRNLEELDLSSFDTSHVTKMDNLFRDCYSLRTIYASPSFVTTNVTDTYDENGYPNMFEGSESLIGGAGTMHQWLEATYNSGDKEMARIDGTFDGTHYLPGYFTDKDATPEEIYYDIQEVGSDLVLSFYSSDGTGREKLSYGSLCSYDYYSSVYSTRNVTKVDFVDEIHPTNLTCAFKDMNVQSFENFDHLKTDKVMHMGAAFYELPLSGNLDLSKWNTSSVTSMYAMFVDAYNLTGITLTGLDLSSVTDMEQTFAGCEKLKTIDLSNLDASNVTTFYGLFMDCSELKSIDFTNFSTSSATNMAGMFRDCYKLTSLDLRSFDTSNVTNMDSMFYECTSLTTVDLSSFDTSKVVYMTSMFKTDDPDQKLTTIYVSDKFDVSNVTESEDMFTNREGLEGGLGTTYDTDHTDKAYARIDGGNTAHGYFTERTALGRITLSGNTAIGETLTVTVTDTDPGVGTLHYEWQRIDVDGNASTIENENGNTYTITDNDGGCLLACVVTAPNTPDVRTLVTKERVLGVDKTVTFVVNLPDTSIDVSAHQPLDQTVAAGGKVVEPATFPKFIEGYAFNGWYSDDALTKQWDFENDAVGEDVTLRAKWNAPIYWRVADNTLYLQSSNADGAIKLENQQFNNAGPTAPWFDTSLYDRVEHVVIKADIYPTYMSYWWRDPNGNVIRNITGLDKIHTEDVVDMSGLFAGAILLNPNTLDLSHFNTSKVQKMNGMFQEVGNDLQDGIYYLDISSFDTSNVTHMNYMFADMDLIQTIYASDSFVTSSLVSAGGTYMFSNCVNLVGECGTTFDWGEINSDYARIDKGSWVGEGYFSSKPETRTIHVQYLDGYGGTTGDVIWTATPTGAQAEFTVNGLKNTTLQVHEQDQIYIEIKLMSGYEFESDPLGSKGQRDDIYSSNYDYLSNVYSGNGYADFEFVMPDEDVWIYVKTQKEVDTAEGSITTYYQIWNTAANDYTAIPAGGTLTAYDENGNVVDSVASGEELTLKIEPMDGYQLAKVKAVYWDVNAGVSYEFGNYGSEINGITIDNATGIGTVNYEVTNSIFGSRLIFEVTFMENMEYALQFLPGIMDGRNFVVKDYAGSLTATVDGNVVKKVKTGEEVELTITPAQDYRLLGLNAVYTDGTDSKAIELLQSKTEENKYSFTVGSVYFSGDETPSIAVLGVFKYGYDVTPQTVTAGGSFSLSVGGNTIGQSVPVGETVTITASPNEGLIVDQLTVLTEDGGRVDVIKSADAENVYTFTMPESNVTVKATFKAASEGTTMNLTGYQTVSAIQNYLNMSGVSEVKLKPVSGDYTYITVFDDLEIPAGKTLTVDDEVILQIGDSVTLTVNDGGLLSNYGQIFNRGTIQGLKDTSSSGFANRGLLFNRGTLDFTDCTIENYGEFYSTTDPSGTFEDYNTSSTVISASQGTIGTCGDWCGYAVFGSENNYEVRIIGTGVMSDFSSDTMPWKAIRDGVKNIVVYDGIQYVAGDSFRGHTGLTTVELPASVHSIGKYAFEGCTNLTTVKLPSDLTDMGIYAFANCGLTSVTYYGAPTEPGIYLPPSLSEVPSFCFYRCPLAEKVVISEGTKGIANDAFDAQTMAQTDKLEEIWLPKSLEYINSAAFIGRDGLTTVYYAGSAAEWSNLLRSVEDTKFTDGTMEVLYYNYVSNLQIANNANGTVKAEVDGTEATTAMGGKNVKLVITPDAGAEVNIISVKTASGTTLTVAQNNTFEMPCEKVTINVTFLFTAGATEFTGSAEQLQGVLNANTSVKLTSDLTLTGDLTIPAGKTLFVMDGATLTIPEEIQVKIEENAILCTYGTVSNSGDLLNKGQISIRDQGTLINETNGAIGNGGRIDGDYENYGVVGVPVTAGGWQYYELTSKDLTVFGDGALPDYDSNNNRAPWKKSGYDKDTLETVTIRKGITSIGYADFYYVQSVKSISIPDGVTSIGGFAFSGTAIETIVIPDSVLTIGNGVFRECGKLNSVTLGKNITSIPKQCFEYCRSLAEFRIDSVITSIGDSAFAGCSSLKKVEFADDCNITEWGTSIFYWCDGLETINLPEGMTEIPYDMFFSCDALKEITIPESVKTIGYSAFYGCEKLQKITLPKNVEILINGAFGACPALTEVTLSENLTTIAEDAFIQCTSLTKIALPEKVKYIGEDAFADCTNLKELTVSKKVTGVHGRAFRGVALTDIYFDGTREEWAEVEDMYPSGATVHCSDDNDGNDGNGGDNGNDGNDGNDGNNG